MFTIEEVKNSMGWIIFFVLNPNTHLQNGFDKKIGFKFWTTNLDLKIIIGRSPRDHLVQITILMHAAFYVILDVKL